MKKRVMISVLLTIGAAIGAYPLWHHSSPLILISVIILAYLVGYKITDYVADFKTVKNHSRIDIIFLLIFCILLCIPASHISKAKKARGENRYLAQKAVLINHKKLNLNFGKEFNEWFNDRFNMRKDAIRTDIVLKCMINRKNCKLGQVVYDKKHNLIYRDNFWGMPEIEGDKSDILKTYVQNVNKLNEYCLDKNIKLYFLIVPRQADFFDFNMPDKRKIGPNPADEVVEYIRANTDVKIVYPEKEMKEANKITPVFFKTDHHWTKKGAYTGYTEIIKEIQKDYPDVKLLDENTLSKYYDKRVSEWWDRPFNPGQTYKHMSLPKFYASKVLDTPYTYYKNPEFKNLERVSSEYLENKRDVYFKYTKGANEKLLVVGDSFGCNLFEFMPYSFKDSLYIYNNPRGFFFENYKPIIEGYRPDVFVVLFYTPNLPKILDFYSNTSE